MHLQEGVVLSGGGEEKEYYDSNLWETEGGGGAWFSDHSSHQQGKTMAHFHDSETFNRSLKLTYPFKVI